ncbi:hypothetical protein ASD8599_03649 [Ascidiaceihabitans donghaensis]|uniref:VWFA domain-containing protein n=1 Tax=Ascidiaceihabitans donghaensis TaxID=1510460 RepID=A0A2R8BIP5_9RHOB|nr:VWA domain-containing protein [Ascidiaceihabitans donghaensis]SPH22902.1 hypothetical protein ASD8599_03649 [Ascidiaceihabitans donghaensis]
MSDDLNDIKAMMQAATPDPDADKKAADLALAQKNFAALQGSADGTRLTVDRPTTGLWTGAKNMIAKLTTPAGLTASTALVAVAMIAFLPMDFSSTRPTGVSRNEAQLAPEFAVAPVSEEVPEPAPAPRTAAKRDTAAPERLMGADDSIANGATNGAADMQVTGAIAGSAPAQIIRQREPVLQDQGNTEDFANAQTNPVQVTSETPVSTFSIDVDTASYAVVRNSLTHGQMPPKDAVRIEEMVNYFSYAYPTPEGQPFQPTVSVGQTPWNPGTQLVHIGIQGMLPALEDRPPLNLVFLIDTSGSMNQANKLPLLKQSFRLMLSQLRPDDEVAIVAYAGSAGQVLAPTKAAERTTILNALNALQSGGGTAGQAGLQQAYSVAEQMTQNGDVSRVILATDGDFNVGLNDPEQLKTFIADKRDSGTYLSVLGFGRGNLDDATMQALAQNGNGTAAYIDTLSEAQKVLVDQLSGALFPIANDVKIQVEFNPATIAEYRLIGYETRALKREDFNNDKVDAGDIGAGHSVTALYEVTPTGSAAVLNDPLRYGASETPRTSDELGFLRLRYKMPGDANSQLVETAITPDLGPLSDAGFASAIAGFGQLLRGSDYLGDWGYADAIALATQTKGDDPFGYRAEAIQLMRLAQSLSE